MSNKHIENLTVRLLQALDKDYDVVNMEGVLSVIGALENATITKEQLEATRLAKYINLFRRRTRSEQLAKRAKSLLKKWREMVGIQQNANETARSEALQPRENPSQITLSLSVNTTECGPLRSNDTQCDNSAVLNSSTTKNTTLLNQNLDKCLETHGYGGMLPYMPVPSSLEKSQNQPTSFANLITNFSTAAEDMNTMFVATQNTSNGPNARRKTRSSIRNTHFCTLPDGLSADQTSNSSSAINYASFSHQTKLSGITEPIVIDIEDSNSDSNIIGCDTKTKDEDVVILDSITGTKHTKHKKGKKEKKRTKERVISSNEATAPLVIIDAESSQSQQPQWQNIVNLIESEKCTSVLVDEKSHNSIKMVTKMSEILSLSNSSMSSVFPTSSVGETKNIFIQHNSHALPESELSFAGKFTSQNTDSLKASLDAAKADSSINPFQSNNDNYGNEKAVIMGPVSNKFHLYNESRPNSNDSASNSRHSNFEVVESISQGAHVPQIQISTIVEASSTPQQKVPKKRGRKKGSKGVDSLIAKDTSLSSHMLMQSFNSGSKKVKTTKELYAEMQNRKLGVSTPTTPSHWNSTQNQSGVIRRDSFCSEPSLHSPRTFDACSTNATISTAATGSTPEKGGLQRHTAEIDSEDDSLISGGLSYGSVTPFLATANTCNKLQYTSAAIKTDNTNVLSVVESKLRNFIQQMPAVPSRLKIEKEIAIDVVPCTCKIIELFPEQKTFDGDISTMKNFLSLDALKSVNTSGDEFEKPVITISVNKSNTTDITTNPVLVTSRETKETHLEKPKKSIFDLDFDEDEDPLTTLMAEVAAANDIIRTEEAEEKEKTLSLIDAASLDQTENCKEMQGHIQLLEQSSLDNNQFAPIPIVNPATIFPTYKIEEDDGCLAKQRFELQTQKITHFHINALHNCYIPNVNGNWDNTPVSDIETKNANKEVAIDNVVPQITNLWDTGNQIRKDLINMNFDLNFKPKQISKTSEQLVYETPFLGVARSLKSSHRKTRKHRKSREVVDRIHYPHELDQPEKISTEDKSIYSNSKLLQEITGEDTGDKFKSSSSALKQTERNLIFSDITISVDDINPEFKPDGTTDTESLLTIASNVNFNNNQIGNHTLSSVNIEESCSKILDKDVVDENLNEDAHAAYCSNGGDIQNNNISNNCNNDDKLEESSCESHSSLKQTQKSINLKLRKHRRQLLEQEQNSPKSYSKRKRRRKESQTIKRNPKVKCIKIAINGGITTQRHVTLKNSSDDDNDDEQDNGSYSSDSDNKDTEPEQRTNDVGTEFFGESGEESNVHASEDGDWEQEKRNDVGATGLHDGELDEYYGGGEEEEDDYEEEELEDDDEYFGEFHEVVTRDISPFTESGNNHIVLTIKKTPSKTNSPSNSLSAMSPIISSNKKIFNKVSNSIEIEKNKENELKTEVCETPASIIKEDIIKTESIELSKKIPIPLTHNRQLENSNFSNCLSTNFKGKNQARKRKDFKLTKLRFPYENSEGLKIFKKLHQQLFFPQEIFIQTAEGRKQRIFNNSSCSSSCCEDSEFEYENSITDETILTKNIVVDADLIKDFSNTQKTDQATDSDDSDKSQCLLNENLSAILGKQNIFLSNVKSEVHTSNNELSNENNGYLISFNNICISKKTVNDPSYIETTDTNFENDGIFQKDNYTIPKSKKCDNLVCTNCNNLTDHGEYKKVADDLKILNSSIENLADSSKSCPEYWTGLRAIHKTTNDEVVTKTNQLEEFKEWHQILQLRSYNDELLTVLPYVVLD